MPACINWSAHLGGTPTRERTLILSLTTNVNHVTGRADLAMDLTNQTAFIVAMVLCLPKFNGTYIFVIIILQ